MTPPGPGLPGIHDWIGTRTAFEIARGPGGPLLAITVAIEAPADREAMMAQYESLAELFGETGQEDFAPLAVASCDTLGILAPAPLTHDTYGVSLAERLAAFVDDTRHWLAQRESAVQPPSLTVYIPFARTAPSAWKADLRQLEVRLTLAADGLAAETTGPAGEDAAFASGLEEAFEDFDGRGTRIKAAHRETSQGRELWLLRWGPAGTHVTFRGETAPPVVLVIPPLSAAPITREVDGASLADVDLDTLASRFLAALEGISPRSDAIAGVRRDLAAAIAATAVPAWRTPGDTFNARAAVEGIARMLGQDLTLATRAASLAQIGASVESGIASGGQPEPEWRLNGAIVTGDAHEMSTGGVALTAGDPTLEIMLVPGEPGASASVAITPVFSADRIEETGAAPLRFPILESVALGPLTMPVPLRTPPPPVTVRAAAASQDDGAADGFAPRWRYAVTIDAPAAAQDTVAVVVAFNGSAASPVAARATATPPAQASLVDAIVRFMGAHTSGAAAAVERARDVVDAWRRWTPDAAQDAAPIEEGALGYAISLDVDGRSLVVEATGDSQWAEVWPSVEGYSFETPEPGTRRARFACDDSTPRGSLTLGFGSLDARRTSSVRASFWIERNRAVAPAGRQIDPRFIRRGAISAAGEAEPPTLRNREPILLPRASSLLVSLQDLLTAIASPAGTQITIAYSYSIAPGLKARLPVLMMSRETAAAAGASAAEIGRSLVAWREHISPPEADGAFEFEIEVWPDDHGRTAPLFVFTGVSLDVSDAPGWWDTGRESGQPPATRV